MKLRADLKLVKQLDYVSPEERNFSYCIGCVFHATAYVNNNMCDRVNDAKLSCGSDMIWVLEDDKSNFEFKEK